MISMITITYLFRSLLHWPVVTASNLSRYNIITTIVYLYSHSSLFQKMISLSNSPCTQDCILFPSLDLPWFFYFSEHPKPLTLITHLKTVDKNKSLLITITNGTTLDIASCNFHYKQYYNVQWLFLYTPPCMQIRMLLWGEADDSLDQRIAYF